MLKAHTYIQAALFLMLALPAGVAQSTAQPDDLAAAFGPQPATPLRSFAAPDLIAAAMESPLAFAQQPDSPSMTTQQTPNPQSTPQQASPATQGTPATTQSTLPDSPQPAHAGQKTDCGLLPCPTRVKGWYMHFINGPQAMPLTPREKAWLAVRNLLDPFNAITILGEAGISVAADSHSAYGPGFPGFGKYVGVSYTEDLTGEFFNTFLIPSIVHQDPRYHRLPNRSIARRITHTVTQVIWTQSDYGKGMLNYANLVGFAIDDEIGNLYVPGRQTNAGATAQRYVIALATAPISNVISEFLPDVAKRIHIQVVVVQRIINHVASNDNNAF